MLIPRSFALTPDPSPAEYHGRGEEVHAPLSRYFGRGDGGEGSSEEDLVFSQCRFGAGTRADWPYFARWHYRSHTLGLVKRVTLLWHGSKPIGICVFCAPARSLRLRNRFFGLKGKGDSLALKKLNQQLWVLARVVIHPTYRGAGLASDFVRASCASCPVPWIETLTVMGHLNPFFEKAGFQRIGVIRKEKTLSPRAYAQLYGGKKLTDETIHKSQHAEPVYYVFRGARSHESGARMIGDG